MSEESGSSDKNKAIKRYTWDEIKEQTLIIVFHKFKNLFLFEIIKKS